MRKLTETEQAWVDGWLPRLPQYLAREVLYKELGGIIKPATLNYHDCRGTGPAIYYKVGRKVLYETRVLLEWIAATLGVTVHRDLAGLQDGTERQRRRGARKAEDAHNAAPSQESCVA